MLGVCVCMHAHVHMFTLLSFRAIKNLIPQGSEHFCFLPAFQGEHLVEGIWLQWYCPLQEKKKEVGRQQGR